MKYTYGIHEIATIANLVVQLPLKNVIRVEGSMGMGKTTFVKALLEAQGVTDTVSSPTFSLVNEYRLSDGKTIYHFDFYRIKTEQEAYDIGTEEYFYSGNPCFVEWAEKIPTLLPLAYSVISFEFVDLNTRSIVIQL